MVTLCKFPFMDESTTNKVIVTKYLCIVKGVKIYGGRHAFDGEYPSTVCLRSDSMMCAGTLVTLSRVITSAHCFNKGKVDLDSIIVIGGTVNIEAKDDYYYKERKLTEYHIHDKHKNQADQDLIQNFALAELDEPFIESKHLKTMTLVSSDEAKFKSSWDEIVSSGTPCTLVGWGMDQYGEISQYLTIINDMAFLDPPNCQNFTNGKDMTLFGQYCSVFLRSQEEFCGGDSGAPFYCGKNIEYAYGITVAKTKCGTNDPYNNLLFWKYINDYKMHSAGTSSFLSLLIILISISITTFML